MTYGCFAIRASSLAMFTGESTKSTHPAATALRGIESYLADSSCAKVIPPSALTASSPQRAVGGRPGKNHADGPARADPGPATPKKTSIGWCGVRPGGLGESSNAPLPMTMLTLGGMT